MLFLPIESYKIMPIKISDLTLKLLGNHCQYSNSAITLKDAYLGID